MTFEQASAYIKATELPKRLHTDRGVIYNDVPYTLQLWWEYYKNKHERENIKRKIIQLVKDLQDYPQGWNAQQEQAYSFSVYPLKD